MGRTLSSQRGQTAPEYAGLILLVALVIAALLTLGVGSTISDGLQRAVCVITGGESCGESGSSGPPPPAATDPRLTPAERQALLGDPRSAQGVLQSLSPQERRWLQDNDPDAAAAVRAAQRWKERVALVERYQSSSLEDFLDEKHSDDRDERMNWTDDGCSAPVVGSTGVSFDFTAACERHDFGYRNYKELGLFDDRKSSVDRRFLQDMNNHCATRSVFLRGRCYDWARTFYAGVVVFG